MTINGIDPDKKYDIPEAAVAMNFTDQYIRSLVRIKKIASIREPVVPMSQVTKHIILGSEMIRFLSKIDKKTRRPDGRYKFNIYASLKEKKEVAKLLRDAGYEAIASTIVLANKNKILDVVQTATEEAIDAEVTS